ncbi:MAG: hypothetical protein QXT33_01475 [Thermofilum sp.]
MNWRDAVDTAVIHAERSTYLLLALSVILIPIYGVTGEPQFLLLPSQLTASAFVGLLAYSYLKRFFEEQQPGRRAFAAIIPSYSALLGVFVPLLNSTPASLVMISTVLGVILSLKLYSAVREYEVIMKV